MHQLLHTIWTILTPPEKRRFTRLVVQDIVINILDLGFLALLVFLVNDQMRIEQKPAAWWRQDPLWTMGGFCLAFALKNYWGYFIQKAQHLLVYQVAARLSEEKLDRFLQSDYEQFVHTDSSVHIRQIGQQPIEFGHYILRSLLQVLSQSVMVLLTVAVVLVYQPGLFLLLAAVLIPPVWFTGRLLRKKLGALKAGSLQASERSLQYLKEALAGFVESRVFARKHFFLSRYIREQQLLNQRLAGQETIQALPSRLMEVFALAGLFVLFLLGRALGSDQLSYLTISAFLAAAYKIIPGMVRIMNATGSIRTYRGILENLSVPAVTKMDPGKKEKLQIRALRFEGVCFSYPGKKILENFNLDINAGEVIGLKGLSGRGKTTVINLVLGFLKPEQGRITINGVDRKSLDKEAVWDRISYVQQRPFFLHDSARANVTMDDQDPDASRFDRVTLLSGFAAPGKKSGAAIREDGKNISGGQRQRIAFARALYKDFDLLILDEPFSEMDPGSAARMLQQLQELAAAGKMILFISHDPESLSFCHRIISLDHA